jgi:hypothetical protein
MLKRNNIIYLYHNHFYTRVKYIKIDVGLGSEGKGGENILQKIDYLKP